MADAVSTKTRVCGVRWRTFCVVDVEAMLSAICLQSVVMKTGSAMKKRLLSEHRLSEDPRPKNILYGHTP
jgi:hypothetical protein